MKEIVKTPGICGGKARFEGTRIPVVILFCYPWWSRNKTMIKEILHSYPSLTEEDVLAGFEYIKLNKKEMHKDKKDFA